jgi:hypothetical protein
MMMMMLVWMLLLVKAPGVTPGVGPGVALGVVRHSKPVASPTPALVVEPVALPPDARIIMNPVGDFGPGLANTNVPGRLVAIDSPNPYPSNVNVELLPRWGDPTAMEAHLRTVSFECMQRFNLYHTILPYLVMFGTVIAPPTGEHGVPMNCIERFPDVPPGPSCSFEWSTFLYYLCY